MFKNILKVFADKSVVKTTIICATIVSLAWIVAYTFMNHNNDKLQMSLFGKDWELDIIAQNKGDASVKKALLSYLEGYKGKHLNDIGLMLLINDKKYRSPRFFSLTQVCAVVIFANQASPESKMRRCDLGELAATHGALEYLKKINFVNETSNGNDPKRTPQFNLTPLGKATYSFLNLDALEDDSLHEKLGMLNVFLNGHIEFVKENRT